MLLAVLLATLPFLAGFILKEPERALLPIADRELPKTTLAPTFQTTAANYFFRYIFQANLDPDGSFLGNLNDVFFPDVNIWTHLVGIVPPSGGQMMAQLVVIPGKEAQAQLLFNAIANSRPGRPFRLGNVGMVGVGGQRTSHNRYKGLWRYSIHVGRGTLYRAYGIVPQESNPDGEFDCRQFTNERGPNGQPQGECDVLALRQIRECLMIRVTGVRIARDNFEI